MVDSRLLGPGGEGDCKATTTRCKVAHGDLVGLRVGARAESVSPGIESCPTEKSERVRDHVA